MPGGPACLGGCWVSVGCWALVLARIQARCQPRPQEAGPTDLGPIWTHRGGVSLLQTLRGSDKRGPGAPAFLASDAVGEAVAGMPRETPTLPHSPTGRGLPGTPKISSDPVAPKSAEFSPPWS